MTGMEVTLVIVGVIFLLGSFFIHDRLSITDMKQIADVSEKEINLMLEKQMRDANDAIIDKVDLAVEESYDATRRALEKETSEKVEIIREYSDTVIESVNKSHNEIMFLYSMLNDKHKELTNLASELSEFSKDMKRREDEMLSRVEQAMQGGGVLSDPVPKTPPRQAPAAEPVKEAVVVEEPKKKAVRTTAKPKAKTTAKKEPPREAGRQQTPLAVADSAAGASDVERSNEEILRLHMNGMSEVDIAKALGRGLGEVRFVIGLYRGDVVK